MKKYNPNATNIKGGPGGYVRVNLPGFGDCFAQLQACYMPGLYSQVWAVVFGWHCGDNKVFWVELDEEARKNLWGTLTSQDRSRAIKVLGRDPYPIAA
jgi:hypothetical protein